MPDPAVPPSPPPCVDDVMGRFSPATRAWFTASFPGPTAAQVGAWDAVSQGDHALVVAPTGSGKTLSAFLWAIDQLSVCPPDVAEGGDPSVSVLYISPLKALASDVERNLASPLVGIRHAATRLGLNEPSVTVGTRTGDTPPEERRAFPKNPPNILITTPESAFLLLTSKARVALAGVRTVIIDEIHALAGTKRGAHLALTLERLDHQLPEPAQRIGLSATVHPVARVAEYLAGARPPGAQGGRATRIVAPPSEKLWDLRVVVPLDDMSELGQPTGDPSGVAAGAPKTASIWPHVEASLVERIDPRTHPGASTLIFTNARRTAERLTARLNESWVSGFAPTDDTGGVGDVTGEHHAAVQRFPAESIAQGGVAAAPDTSHVPRGLPVELARAHHGSVSKERRREIEEALKVGELPAVVATSSLELGIDMGAIDEVINISPPPSVASGLQRVGRAGHQVGAVSRGITYPKHRSELLPAVIITERMLAGDLEPLAVPANPLDVLAQHIVAMTALDDWTVDDLAALVRRATPFASISTAVLQSVLDMLSGRYPSTDFAELRPRIVWDRVAGTLSGRPGAQRLAVTSGGTIPDRGLFGVFLATGDGPGRRVGELDEEMVYESRVGDVFTLGSSTWRIEDITYDRVLVTPAPGQPGRLPFWRGENQGRPLDLGRALGALHRELVAAPGGITGAANTARLRAAGLDDNATRNALAYVEEQVAATGVLPDDRTVVVEKFRDELGDWRVVIHSPWGLSVHAPWSLVLAATLSDRLGMDVQAMPSDDGIVLRVPDMLPGEDGEDPLGADLLAAIAADPDTIADQVTDVLGESALFASRFRECAARALLLPRRRPDRRQPLWQQRQRASQLLSVASKYPGFPIVLETVRECVQDVFDVPGLVTILRAIRSREITVTEVTTPSSSPFARSLLFGYVAQFLYEGDSPLAERRAAALALDPELLADLLGRSDGTTLADLLDPAAVRDTHHELQRLTEDRQARSAEDITDLLRVLGPLTPAEIAERVQPAHRASVDAWVAELVSARRVFSPQIGARACVAVMEDAGMLRDALGVPLPVGVPDAFAAPTEDPLTDLVARFARTRAPFTADQLAAYLGVGVAVATDVLRRLVARGTVNTGVLLPEVLVGDLPGMGSRPVPDATQYGDADVLRRLRRRSLAALRAEVEPVTEGTFAAFSPAWQNVAVTGDGTTSGGVRGVDGLMRVVEALAGAQVPASALETLVLPARVTNYRPAMLDELCTSGDVVWMGHGSLPGHDGWVSLHPADTVDLTRPEPSVPSEELGDVHAGVLEALRWGEPGGGAFFFREVSTAVGSVDDAALAAAIWDLVWAGYITGDTPAPLRALLSGGKTAHKAPASPRRGRQRPGGRSGLRGLRRTGASPALSLPTRTGPPSVAGRWSALPVPEQDGTVRAHAAAEVLLERYGVVTRGSVAAEHIPGGFAAVYRVLAAKEDAGQVRRGYFVAGRGASQFATAGAVDRLRATETRGAVVLASADPANPFGAALPWPTRDLPGTKHRPGRRAGALVAIVGGALVAYMERGAKTLITFTDDRGALDEAIRGVMALVHRGAITTITINTINGEAALTADATVRTALTDGGFHLTPRGVRARR